jgi:uncharacterized membrane protein YbaN (DUF454 family)
MKTVLTRLFKLALAWLLLFLGIVGLFLPILQGLLFIFLGLALLSSQSQWIRNKIEFLQDRFPHQAARLQALREKLRSALKKPSVS